jgi:hypothetical protein
MATVPVQDVSEMFTITVNGVLYKLDDILNSQVNEIKSQNIRIKELTDKMEGFMKNTKNIEGSGYRYAQPLSDLKGLQKLDKFTSNKQCFRQWKMQLMTIISSKAPEHRTILKEAEISTEPIELDKYVGAASGTIDIDLFSAELYHVLTITLGDTPLSIIENVSSGCGLESWRQLTQEYDAKTPQNLQTLVQQVVQPKRVKSLDQVVQAIQAWETMRQEYVLRLGKDLDNPLKICALRAIVPQDLDDTIMKMNLHNSTFEKLREYIREQVQIHRNSSPTPMQTNNFEQETQGGEDWPCQWDASSQNSTAQGEDLPVDYFTKGKGKGKGPGGGKGGKGKGGKGGKGEGGKGKGNGKTAAFQGYCGYCWKWGHMKKDCRTRMRDEGHGGNNGGRTPMDIDRAEDEEEHMALCLECGSSDEGEEQAEEQVPHPITNDMIFEYSKFNECPLWQAEEALMEELDMITKPEKVISRKEVRFNPEKDMILFDPDNDHTFIKYIDYNRFDELMNDGEGEDETPNDPVVTLTDHETPQDPVVTPIDFKAKKKTTKKMPRVKPNAWKQVTAQEELHVCGLETEDRGNDDDVLELGEQYTLHVEATLDSGASHSVAPHTAAPGVKVNESEGSKRGQHYVAAGGQRIPNIGEQTIKFKTKEGKRSSLKWQNAEVSKPLLSISHICDSGHEVTFTKTGGMITNSESGRTTTFRRKNNVYVLDMLIDVGDKKSTAPFHRQGR